jgi:hypothetical protein
MSQIISITLSYDAGEDRIRFAALLKDGRKACFWLTQRLARRLVAALSNHLEKAEALPLSTVRDAMLAHEQAQAVSGIKPQPPVRPEPASPVHLVSNITLKLAAEKMELGFASDLDWTPTIALDRTLVRQWLSMLHRQFVSAEWPLDCWPVWLVEGSAQSAGTPATRH